MPKKASEETGLVVRESKSQQLSKPRNFEPTTFSEALTFASYIAKSDLAPKDYKGNTENCFIAMQMGAEVGLSPMAAIQNIAVINGRPSLWGDAALGVVMVHPAYEWHKEYWEGEGKTLTAVFEIKRRGHEVYVSKFSFNDAATAELLGKDTWKKYLKRMLQMRARGYGMRDKFPDALRGLSIAEEAMDMPPVSFDKLSDKVDLETGKILKPEKRDKEVATLEPSKEVNRGHGDEGLNQTQGAATSSGKEDVQENSTDKSGETILQTNIPEEHAIQDGATNNFIALAGTVTRIDPKMSAITAAQKAKAKKEKQPEPNPRPYFVLTVQTTEGDAKLDVPVYVWHKSMHEYVVKALNKSVVFGLERTVKNEGTEHETAFYSLEEIHRIADTTFVDNKPTAAPSAEQLGFSGQKEEKW